ncbi:MAG: helix-turn-helix transcriptional regulator [Clostridiales bacterium]|nr:helix-turn-helix transcriptional regulator [Clostridiales bacterium]
MIKLDNIREKIIEAIKQSGLTQTEIANRLGVKQATIGQYLSGRAMPALDTFANLCKILDLDSNEILCISNK